MTRNAILTLAALSAWPAHADTLPVTAMAEGLLDRMRWQARPVIVLGREDLVQDQIARLQARADALAERDVIVLTDGPGAEGLREDAELRVLLVGKDGGVKLSEAGPVPPERLIDMIDAMPMRRNETR